MGKLLFKIFDPGGTFHGVDYNEKKYKRLMANFEEINKKIDFV